MFEIPTNPHALSATRDEMRERIAETLANFQATPAYKVHYQMADAVLAVFDTWRDEELERLRLLKDAYRKSSADEYALKNQQYNRADAAEAEVRRLRYELLLGPRRDG